MAVRVRVVVLRVIAGCLLVSAVLLAGYHTGLDRVEAFANRLLYGRLVSVDKWIYLKGEPYFKHQWPRDGTVRILGMDLDGTLWIVYWVPSNFPGALIPPEGYYDECFYPAHSTDFGKSWTQGGVIPDEIRGTMNEAFSSLKYNYISSREVVYRIMRRPLINYLHFKLAGKTEWGGGPCQFESVKQEEQRFVLLLAVDPTDPRHIFVTMEKLMEPRTSLEGLWESRDGGSLFIPLRWSPQTNWTGSEGGDSLGRRAFHFLAVDPLDHKRLITDEDGRLMSSTDGGKEWRTSFPPQWEGGNPKPLLSFPKASWHVRNEYYSGIFDPVRAGHVYVTSNRGLLVSSDAGQSWRLANIGTGGLWPELTICAVPEAKAVFVGSRRGLLKTTDGGNTWGEVPLDFQRSWWKRIIPYLPHPDLKKSQYQGRHPPG